MSDLPAPWRGYAILLVAVGLLACALIVLFGFGWYPSGPTIETPVHLSPTGLPVPIPFSLAVVLLVGLGIAAGILFFTSYRPGWVLPTTTRIVVGLLGIAFPLSSWQFLRSGGFSWHSLLILLSLGSGAAVLFGAFLREERFARPGGWLALGSFGWLSLSLLVLEAEADSADRALAWFAEVELSLQLGTLVSIMAALFWLIGAVFFWQIVAEVRVVARLLGFRTANVVTRSPHLLFSLFAIKIGWLALGYGGKLGADWTIREGTTTDGPLACCVAAVYAAGTAWWLWRSPPAPAWLPAKSAVVLTVGFLLPSLLTVGLLLLRAVCGGVTGRCPRLHQLAEATAGVALPWGFLFAAALLPIGVALRGSRKLGYLAPLAILTGLWTLPRVVAQFMPQGNPVLYYWTNPSFEYLTYDVWLTGMLLVIAVAAWRRGRLSAEAWTLTFVLVVSTFVAQAGSLLPSAWRDPAFYLLLAFPFVYQQLSGYSTPDDSEVSREAMVIQRVALGAVLMLVVMWAVVAGMTSPRQPDWGTVANLVFFTPFLALHVAAAIASRRRQQESGRPLTS